MPHPTHGRASSHEIPVRALSLAPHQIVAALEGRLSQLRYPVVSDIPEGARLEPLEDGHGWDVFVDSDGRSHWRDTIRPPLGVPGARHWVQEAYARSKQDDGQLLYRATHDGPAFESLRYSWRSSRQMPRHAARLVIEVQGIRLSRLSDMTEEDAITEGHLSRHESRALNPLAYAQEDWEWRFGRRHPWSADPMTWVVTVKAESVCNFEARQGVAS